MPRRATDQSVDDVTLTNQTSVRLFLCPRPERPQRGPPAVMLRRRSDETIFLIRRSHPETNECSICRFTEETYDGGRRGGGCLVQHLHLHGSCFRRVSDALTGIFMDCSVLPSTDPSTVWLVNLIEATEVVAASAEPCDPAIMKAFSHRLEIPELSLPFKGSPPKLR